MRKVKKWRYYCDFCKKSGASRYHMERHEKKCTSNPNRICGICDAAGFTQQPSEKLVATYKSGGIKKLRELSENCPMCLLSTLKASIDLNDWTGEPWDEDPWERSFDFQKELKAFWDEQNSEPYGSEYF